jgi:signal transduction histidine kinase
VTRRLLASYLTLAAIVLLALEIPLAVVFARNERQDLTRKVERDAVALASLSESALEPGGVGLHTLRPQVDAYAKRTGGRVVVVRLDGQSITDTNQQDDLGVFASRPEFIQALGRGPDGKAHTATGIRHSATLGGDILYVAVPITREGVVLGAVRITFPTSEVDSRVHRTWIILGALAVIVLGVSALVGLRFAQATVVPLARLERTADAAGAGDLTVRASVEGPPEVRSLATRFNQMVGRLGDMVRSQETFVADASHQLRTPLAALRLRLENMDRGRDGAGRDDVEQAIGEVDRLNRLVDGLLVLARADSGGATAEPIDLGALVHDRVDLWSALAQEQDVHVAASVSGSTWVLATPGRLDQVLDNLIENALAVSPPDATVTVSLTNTARGVELHVRDQGPGMTEEERTRAFDRFWRSERTKSEGTGLGLAIVRRLVESDGGSIELREAPGGGLDVAITLVGGAAGSTSDSHATIEKHSSQFRNNPL